ncbi:ribonuclease H-like domain-containing protein [Tanacetum coccineum]
MEAYFQKIESLVTTLTSLDCIVNEEDVVHYAIDGLPKKYNQVCGYMHYQNTFPDLKTVRSLLVTEEMRLMTKEIALPADSSSPMVLKAQSGTPRRSSNTQGKSWKPCFNFANGSCRFGSACHYVHDLNAKPITNTHAKHSSFNNTEALLTKILDKLRDYRNSSEPSLVNHTNSLPVARALLWVDFLTRRVLLQCDSTEDLYPVTAPSPIPHAFLVSQHTWHQRLRHPGSDVLRRLVSNNVISCNKEKPLVLCHACKFGKHVRLPFVSSNTAVTSCFDIIHSNVWTSPIPSLSSFKYFVMFLDHYSHFVWVYPLVHKSDVLSKFVLFHNYVRT